MISSVAVTVMKAARVDNVVAIRKVGYSDLKF